MIDTPGCPQCGEREATAVSFTWWGGLVGPRMLNHVRCVSCGSEFNSKTGQSNQKAIWIYMGVIFVIALLFFGMIFALSFN